MRQYEKAAEKLGCWMRERTVGSSQLSRQTGIDAGTIRHILSGRAARHQHEKHGGAGQILRRFAAGADGQTLVKVCLQNIY